MRVRATERRLARMGLVIAGATTLAACGGHDRDKTPGDTASISFEGTEDDMNGNGSDQTVSLEVPGYSGKLSVPGLAIATRDTAIDGIKLNAGARITRMNVVGKAGDGTGGEGKGTVELGFADPAAPAAVLAYYRDAAKGAGWTEVPPAGGEQFAATKQETKGTERLGLRIQAAGAGSTGRFVVTGE